MILNLNQCPCQDFGIKGADCNRLFQNEMILGAASNKMSKNYEYKIA